MTIHRLGCSVEWFTRRFPALSHECQCEHVSRLVQSLADPLGEQLHFERALFRNRRKAYERVTGRTQHGDVPDLYFHVLGIA